MAYSYNGMSYKDLTTVKNVFNMSSTYSKIWKITGKCSYFPCTIELYNTTHKKKCWHKKYIKKLYL